MANTHQFETKFSKRMQSTFYNRPVFRALVNTEERANLVDGQSVTRPRKGLFVSQDITRGSDLSMQTINEEAETLTVNTAKSSPFSIDSLDAIQSNYQLMNEYADDAMAVVNAAIDADVLAEYSNATSTVDAGDVGGSSGSPISLTTSNILKVLSKATMKLRRQNVQVTDKFELSAEAFQNGVEGGRKVVGKGFVAESPEFAQVLDEYYSNRETVGGDQSFANGYTGKAAYGLECYMTNNAAWSAVLALATQPTASDTLTIDGVTVTFVSTIGSTAGNVLIGADVDATRANLAGLLTNPGTTSATQVAVSSTRANNYTLSDKEKFDRITATNDDTANTLTTTAKGVSYLEVASSLTDGSDGWTKETQHILAGRKGATDMVIQAEPQVMVSDIPLQIGKYVKPYSLYGLKTYNEGARALVDIQIDSSSF